MPWGHIRGPRTCISFILCPVCCPCAPLPIKYAFWTGIYNRLFGAFVLLLCYVWSGIIVIMQAARFVNRHLTYGTEIASLNPTGECTLRGYTKALCHRRHWNSNVVLTYFVCVCMSSMQVPFAFFGGQVKKEHPTPPLFFILLHYFCHSAICA